MKRTINSIMIAIACTTLVACATLNSKSEGPLSGKEKWGIVPLTNNTETPYASERATSITQSLLHTRGIGIIELIPSAPTRADEGVARQQPVSLQEALEQARKKNLKYLLTGTVTEWRYKVGLDGEPVAGATMQIVDVQTGKVVWSAVGGKSGWSREALSSVGQKVISGMLETLPLAP